MKCQICKTEIHVEEERKHQSEILCEDCYIDELMPKKPKSHYKNGSEFMQRLKDSYPVRNQQYH
jgi:hypothetical protein